MKTGSDVAYKIHSFDLFNEQNELQRVNDTAV